MGVRKQAETWIRPLSVTPPSTPTLGDESHESVQIDELGEAGLSWQNPSGQCHSHSALKVQTFNQISRLWE